MVRSGKGCSRYCVSSAVPFKICSICSLTPHRGREARLPDRGEHILVAFCGKPKNHVGDDPDAETGRVFTQSVKLFRSNPVRIHRWERLCMD